MNWILVTLLVIVGWFVLAFIATALFALPTVIEGYKQRRLDEYYLAEMRTAELKAKRHRDVS